MKDLNIAEEAARWLCELREGDRAQQAAFFAWLRRSPLNVEEFLFATTMWQKLHAFGQKDPARVQRLIAAAQAVGRESANVVALTDRPLPSGAAQKMRGAKRLFVIAAAASVLIACAGALWLLQHRTPTFTTDIGEQRIVRLEDGSRVDLNTRSRIAVEFTERGRDIRLLEGEALFTVAKDAKRPFRVVVDGATIQALGTQFNVYRQTGGTHVSVLEGVVQINDKDRPDESPRLSAGDQAHIQTNGHVDLKKTADIADTVAWRERRLVFRSDRLEDVVNEVNRYSRQPIRIEDATAREVRLTAIFDADDPRALVRFLKEMNGVAVEERNGEIAVRSRP